MLGFTKRKDTNRWSAKKQTVTFNKRHRGHFCHNGGRSSFSFFVVVSSSFFSFKRDVISVVLISNVCQLSYIFNNDPCNSHDTPQFIGSLTHISTVIVFCRVPNYKPVVINNMPVEGKLIEGSCPCDCRSGIAKYVTFDNSVPCFISGDRLFRFRFKSCWNCKTKENKRKKS